MNGLIDLLAGTQGGDDDGHLIVHTGLEVFFEPVIGAVDDLVDRKGRGVFPCARDASRPSVSSASHSRSREAGLAFRAGMTR